MSAPVEPGQVLAGKYEVERVLGEGGMGVVVAAKHLELGQRVAVKFLLASAMIHKDAPARFMREARAAVKITSEHVARVIDVGKLEDGAPYMVMEYLEGRDLASVVSSGPIPVEDAVDYVLQASEAVAEAHAAGIVHRDLKPANLFLTKRADKTDFVKVLDFGISKVADVNDASLTKTAALLGSPYYMSPEQAKSARSVDARADVWALGAILFELVAGTTAFAGESVTELLAAILMDDPRKLAEHAEGVAPEFEAIVVKCLQKNPDDRFQNVAELSIALGPFAPARARASVDRISKILGHEPMTSDPPPAPSVPPPEQAAQTNALGTVVEWSDTNPALPKKRFPAWIAAVTGVVVVGAGAAFALTRSPDASAPPASAEPASASQTTSDPPAVEMSAAPVVAPAAPAEPEVAPVTPIPSAEPAPPPRPRAAPRQVAPKPAAKPSPKPVPAKPTPAPKPKSALDMELK